MTARWTPPAPGGDPELAEMFDAPPAWSPIGAARRWHTAEPVRLILWPVVVAIAAAVALLAPIHTLGLAVLLAGWFVIECTRGAVYSARSTGELVTAAHAAGVDAGELRARARST